MIYLDYCATTFVDEDILEEFINITRNTFGNVNSIHKYGENAKKLFDKTKSELSKVFLCNENDLIFTSGATESNVTAIRGTAEEMESVGKHIISTKLEHKSILDELNRLEKLGYAVDYVRIKQNGQIDLDNLRELIRQDTILISICGVNSEMGYIQDLKKIRQIINEENPRIMFHSDLTQALGKIKIDLSILDLASFSGHKIYAPIGCGLLYKNGKRKIRILLGGTTSNYPYRGGTLPLAMVVSFSKAIIKAINNMEENNSKCKLLNNVLISGLKRYPIVFNSTENSICQIINISLIKEKGSSFVKKLSDNGICVSSGNACCSSLDESIALDAVNNNNKRISTTSIRISISHYTTINEIYKFLEIFNILY